MPHLPPKNPRITTTTWGSSQEFLLFLKKSRAYQQPIRGPKAAMPSSDQGFVDTMLLPCEVSLTTRPRQRSSGLSPRPRTHPPRSAAGRNRSSAWNQAANEGFTKYTEVQAGFGGRSRETLLDGDLLDLVANVAPC